MKAIVGNKEDCKNAIISIGRDLIERAEEISSDLEGIGSITIHAELNPSEIVNYDVTKNIRVRQIVKTCKMCNNTFIATRKDTEYCSGACRVKYFRYNKN